LDEKRMAGAHQKLRCCECSGWEFAFCRSEVDILKDGSLDYTEELLSQFEVVVCSVHSYMNLDRAGHDGALLPLSKSLYAD